MADVPRIVIQADTGYPSRGTPWSMELAEGAEATFGRGTARSPVAVVLDNPAISRLAGSIFCCPSHWEISNLSRNTTYVVDNPDSGGFVKIAPGRIRAPIPFEFSRVSLPTQTGSVSFLVFAPDHHYESVDTAATGVATLPTFPLDRSAKYFHVLVALCEPQLRDPTSVLIPSVSEIIKRLGGMVPTEAAAYFHINYLARTKLRIREPESNGQRKADWQRAALVTTALRYDLVRPSDLQRLPLH
jgi:hypothetical protein